MPSNNINQNKSSIQRIQYRLNPGISTTSTSSYAYNALNTPNIISPLTIDLPDPKLLGEKRHQGDTIITTRGGTVIKGS